MAEITKEMIYELAVAICTDLDGLVAEVHDIKQEVTVLRVQLENFPRLAAIDPAH